MKHKEKKCVAIFFLVLIGFLFVGIPGKYLFTNIQRHFQQAEISQKSESQKVFSTNWEDLYPFGDSSKKIKAIPNNASDDYPIGQKYYRQYVLSCSCITDYINNFEEKYFILKDDDVLYWYGKINKMVGMDFIKDIETTTVNIDNEYLTYITNYETDNDVAIANTISFSNWLKERNVEFLFVSAPSKLLNENNMITNINVSNYAGKEKLCSALKEEKINVLNISDYMPTDYEEYLSRFYKTDHHWKTETGLWASRLIANELSRIFSDSLDLYLLDDSQYEPIVIRNTFLGSQGRKVGLGYTNYEDFILLKPVYNNQLNVFIPKEGIDVQGDFMTLIDSDYLHKNNDTPYADCYKAYMHGNQPLVRIENEEAKCKEKVLILQDSFARTVEPYLAMLFSKVDIIDLRYFSGSLKTYIENNKYDCVVDITYTSGSGSEEEINNTSSLWYFE